MITHDSDEEFLELFEENLTKHAGELIDRAYPALLAAEGLSDDEKTDMAGRIVINWLAAVESTQNPELIRAALARLKTLPYINSKKKQELVELLIRDGFTMLG
ncbi:MAG: hypothetical protein EPN22_15030 [Nitrospirae bacterium]|nr:MAG: hypothetical protein EPN22_15030 [Nitrospirota bacterium]